MIAALLLPLVLAAPPQEQDSLEDLRDRLVAQLDAQVAAVQPRVDTLLLDLVAARRDKSARRAAEKRAELHALPPAAALVLVERLVPKDPEGEGDQWLAQEAGVALRSVTSAAILPRLDELSGNSNDLTRRLAIAALGAVPDRGGATRVLERLVSQRGGADRAEALGALVRQGGAPAQEAVLAAVAAGHRDAVARALGVSASLADPGVGPVLDAVLVNGDLARQLWSPVLDCLEAVPAAVQPERAQRLVGLALSGAVRGDEAAELVERVGRLDLQRRHVQDQLEALSRSGDVRVATSALVALSVMGDRNARATLMEPIDREVDEAQRGQPGPLRSRGQMKTRLGDYAGAINDFKRALKEAKDAGAFVQREINVDMARAYLLNERLDKAAGALEDAQLSNARREELAVLPEFRVLAEHPRYGEVFEPQ